MAKRGRPSRGGTGTIGLPRNIYLMLSWVAASSRTPISQYAAGILAGPLADLYLYHFASIRRRKALADEQAKLDEVEPLELPDIKIEYPPGSGTFVPIEQIPAAEWEKLEPHTLRYSMPFQPEAEELPPPFPRSAPHKPAKKKKPS
jgi:hypothetical protein